MAEYVVLEPEVAGGLGERSVLDRSTHPPTVHHLHYEFDGWLGDDLVTTFPCFLVTLRLADALQRSTYRSFLLSEVEVTESGLFRELHPGKELPQWRWLRPTGTAGNDAFAAGLDGSLVVSRSALELLRQFNLSNCGISDWLA